MRDKIESGQWRVKHGQHGWDSRLVLHGLHNGQCQKCSKLSTNPHLFRSKPTAPGLWTSRKAWNKLIKSSHGNLIKRKAEKPSTIPSFNVITKNITGRKTETRRMLDISSKLTIYKKVKTLTLAGQDEVESLRLLGLNIDNKLTYEQHTKIVCGRMAGKINALSKLHHKASFKTHKEVTVSLVHSTIEFCAEIYLRTYKNELKVQKKLNSTIWMLLDAPEYDASCMQMMADLNWLNVANMWRWPVSTVSLNMSVVH